MIDAIKDIYYLLIDTFNGIRQIVTNLPNFFNYIRTFISFIIPAELRPFLFLAITIGIVIFIVGRR